jgi:Spy/CpxP family protein refolding chaperone
MSDSRIRVWFTLFVLAVFCVGLAGGVLIGRWTSIDRMALRGMRPPREFGPPPGGRPGVPPAGMLLERLTRDLDLTSDQRSQIENVLVTRRSRLDALQQDVHARFEAEQRSLRDEIRKVLTPEQQEKFDKQQADGRRGFGFGRRPPPPR